MWLTVHGVCTDTIRVFTGSWLWVKNPLRHQGLVTVSVLHLVFQLDVLPTELSLTSVYAVQHKGRLMLKLLLLLLTAFIYHCCLLSSSLAAFYMFLLLFLMHSGLLSVLHNPPNSDMNYRLFNVCLCTFCIFYIGRFSEAGLLEWMRFVIIHARSCERLQGTSGPISE